ncbi:hypothetical protein PLICRDRAFT_604658 [Plicaturopsis crispa FD-325 SS-3]|nr:hypothetical protein PLICRDRAFT_604658 [Plicaturopsis crispa FD-325 SS-3]
MPRASSWNSAAQCWKRTRPPLIPILRRMTPQIRPTLTLTRIRIRLRIPDPADAAARRRRHHAVGVTFRCPRPQGVLGMTLLHQGALATPLLHPGVLGTIPRPGADVPLRSLLLPRPLDAALGTTPHLPAMYAGNPLAVSAETPRRRDERVATLLQDAPAETPRLVVRVTSRLHLAAVVMSPCLHPRAGAAMPLRLRRAAAPVMPRHLPVAAGAIRRRRLRETLSIGLQMDALRHHPVRATPYPRPRAVHETVATLRHTSLARETTLVSGEGTILRSVIGEGLVRARGTIGGKLSR